MEAERDRDGVGDLQGRPHLDHSTWIAPFIAAPPPVTLALTLPVLIGLARACAPQVPPETLLSVARAESGFDPLTIGINARPHRSSHPANRNAAIAEAKVQMASGANIDVGLTQINTANFGRLGLDLEQAFDPCTNLRAGAQLLTLAYQGTSRRDADPQSALRGALSTYNTGDSERGIRNGYVAKVYKAAQTVVPALSLTIARERVNTLPVSEPFVTEPVVLHRDRGAPPAAVRTLDVFKSERPRPSVWAGVSVALPSPHSPFGDHP